MTEKKRTMYAPWPELGTRPPTVISVELGEDEDVEWIWTHTDDGESVVTGYAITQRTDKPKQKREVLDEPIIKPEQALCPWSVKVGLGEKDRNRLT